MTSTTSAHPGSIAFIEPAITACLDTIRRGIVRFGDLYPDDTTLHGRYPLRPAAQGFPLGGNRGWTTSFWAGLDWLGHDLTGDLDFLGAGLRHAADFGRRVNAGEDLDTHDLGFLYTLSCVTAWRATGDGKARQAALAAADHLMGRFLEPAGIIQAWGDLSDPQQRGRTIIDSLMNMPLLSWAAAQTGDARYTEVVDRHVHQLQRHIMREDDSTFHTFYWDPQTGRPLYGRTEQGAGDDSCWARGQAWGIYGFALNHRALGDPSLLDTARRCADKFLGSLPSDRVPYWDLVHGDGSDEPRDSSAGAIAVCGLLELADLDDDAARAQRYADAARDLLEALVNRCTPALPESSDALLLHGVYDRPKDVGVDEGSLWGDYFYLEALTRLRLPSWRPAW